MFQCGYQLQCGGVVFVGQIIDFVCVYVMFVGVGVVNGNCMGYQFGIDCFDCRDFGWVGYVQCEDDMEIVVFDMVKDGGGNWIIGQQIVCYLYCVCQF